MEEQNAGQGIPGVARLFRLENGHNFVLYDLVYGRSIPFILTGKILLLKKGYKFKLRTARPTAQEIFQIRNGVIA